MADEPKKPEESGDAPTDAGRDKSGRFTKGNPGGTGRRRMDPAVQEMLQAATPKAAQALIAALDAERAVVLSDGVDLGQRIEFVPDHDMRIKAANAIFDRVHGKPAQAVTDAEGNNLPAGLVFLPSIAPIPGGDPE